jgi:release factor glutamine methyltransferase
MLTLLEVIKRTTDFFAARRLDSPRLNAELLIGHALGLRRMQLYLQFERPLTEGELEKIRPLVRRRGQHEPLQYVIGQTEFHGLTLKVDRRALIPRPETEQLVELAITSCAVPPPRVLDLGTGSGAIALALARHFPEAVVTAVDVSPDALQLAGENAAATGLAGRVRFLEGSWFACVPTDKRFDLVVANPPYLSAQEVAAAPTEVRDFEPGLALVSGQDGLADLLAILRDAPRFLASGGMLAMETGPSHHAALNEAATASGYSRAESHRDLAGRDRFFVARL